MNNKGSSFLLCRTDCHIQPGELHGHLPYPLNRYMYLTCVFIVLFGPTAWQRILAFVNFLLYKWPFPFDMDHQLSELNCYFYVQFICSFSICHSPRLMYRVSLSWEIWLVYPLRKDTISHKLWKISSHETRTCCRLN